MGHTQSAERRESVGRGQYAQRRARGLARVARAEVGDPATFGELVGRRVGGARRVVGLHRDGLGPRLYERLLYNALISEERVVVLEPIDHCFRVASATSATRAINGASATSLWWYDASKESSQGIGPGGDRERTKKDLDDDHLVGVGSVERGGGKYSPNPDHDERVIV